MPLVIDNRTKWSTPDLRRFFLKGLASKGASTDKYIKVVYGKGGALWGCAELGRQGVLRSEGLHITMSMPGPQYVEKHGDAAIDYEQLAQVFEHEVDHTLGLNHREMTDWRKLNPTWHTELRIAWAAKQINPLSDEEKKARRLEGRAKKSARDEARARLQLSKAEHALKLAKARVQKWAVKVRRYDKARASKPPKGNQ